MGRLLGTAMLVIVSLCRVTPLRCLIQAEVDQNVVVCSFMPKASELMSTYWQGTPGYRLYCGDNVMQLFDKQRQNSFVFMIRPPAASGTDIVTSIALNKISHRVQQVGAFPPLVTILSSIEKTPTAMWACTSLAGCEHGNPCGLVPRPNRSPSIRFAI